MWYAPGRARVRIPTYRYAPIVHICIFFAHRSSHALAEDEGGSGEFLYEETPEVVDFRRFAVYWGKVREIASHKGARSSVFRRNSRPAAGFPTKAMVRL